MGLVSGQPLTYSHANVSGEGNMRTAMWPTHHGNHCYTGGCTDRFSLRGGTIGDAPLIINSAISQ